ncbi:hypothetical protein B0H14DRAFT_2775691 [Mycena olivaceomarginata]|nr:hypothetical protein B0H14DRAFT_2775691 [Mycena olivaceomarginata]
MRNTLEETCSPAERPPDEVLALIFRLAAETPLAPSEDEASWVISSVNQRWRAIALSSPELWTTIRISRRHSLGGTQLFLARSTPLPFRLSINTEVTGPHPLDAARILEMLLPHIRWCSALALCVSADDLCKWSSVLRRTHLHSVRTLSITIHSSAPDELWGPPESLFDFTALCTGVRSLRLGPAMKFQHQLRPPRLTKLDVRCTWDGAFIRHVCSHSQVLESLVLACARVPRRRTRRGSHQSRALSRYTESRTSNDRGVRQSGRRSSPATLDCAPVPKTDGA